MGRRFAASVVLTLSLATILTALGCIGPVWIRGRDSASAAELTKADLSITKTDSKDPVAFFEPFTYTVRVDNAGPEGAAHVGVSDFLPVGLGVVSMDSKCQFVEGQMYCELGNIAGGGSAEAHFNVQAEANAPATIENHATINATENNDPNPGNNEDIETTTVSGTPPPSADLKLGLTDSKDPVTVGEALTYSLAIGNEGPDAGAEVEAAAVLPLSLEVKSAGPGCSTAGGTIHCVLATLAPGTTATRQFTVVPTQAGKVSVNASVSAKGSHDPVGTNNSAVQTTEVQAAPAVGPPVEPLRLRVNPEAPASPRGKFAILDVAISGPSTETVFKVDGSPAFHTDPGAPFVGFRFATVGVHTVTTTVVGIGGNTVSTSTPLIIRPGSTSTARPTFFPDIAVAASNPSLISGGPASGACVPDSTAYFGAVEAKGCFRKVATAADIPPAERAAASEYVSTNILIESAQFANRCRLGDTTCHFNPNALRIADPNLKPFVATGAVHVNGMTVEPLGSASIVVFPAISRLISSNARISYDGSVFGSIPVKKGPLNLDLNSGIKRFTDGDAEVPLFSFDTSQAFKDVGGFPINGKVEIVFRKKAEQRATALKLNISLPEQITTAARADPTAKVEVLADNQRGTYLGFLNFHMNEAFLGPVELQNVDFTYNDSGEQGCARKWWKATAEVFFIPVSEGDEGAGIKMAPEPQRNGVAFCAGDFHSAGADLHFGYPIPPPEILPGVTLNEIGFDFQLQKPVLFDGFATIKAAEIVTATGGFLTAFASPQHPYTFRPGDAGGALHLLAGKTYTSTTIALGGRVFIEPEEDIELELGSAYLLYNYPDYIIAHGSAHLQTFLFAINAEANFEASSRTRKFNALLAGEVCLAGGVKIAHIGACAGGEARVSSRGLSVCFNVLDGTWTPGVGELYGHVPEFFLGTLGDGCKPSHFWEANVRTAARASAAGAGVPGSLTFHVESGEKAKNIELVGAGGAPAVTIRGPGGETLASQPNLMLHQGRLSAMSVDAYNRTWLGIEDAKPGTYQVIPQPGSVPVANVRETHYEPSAAVKASVSGKGRHLVLSYDAGHAKGQKVSFFERGKGTWELLKSVSGGKGKVAFQPSFGPGGRRSIAAQVEVDGIPAPLQTLAHFKAPPPPRAGRVKAVHVSRHGSRLMVTWSKIAFAQGYAVVVEEQGGLVRSLRVDGKRDRVTLKGISASEAGRVEVVAFGPLGDRGKPGHADFKATRKQTTRLLAYKELGYATPFVGELGPKHAAHPHGGRRSHH